MLNVTRIYNSCLSQHLYGNDDVSFNVYFDNLLNIKKVRSSVGSDLTYLLSDEDFEEIRQFVKEDVVLTAQEFKFLEMHNKVGYC
jgi:hypothetical protein